VGFFLLSPVLVEYTGLPFKAFSVQINRVLVVELSLATSQGVW
jgi:hypothetical protein